jgi:HMG box factor
MLSRPAHQPQFNAIPEGMENERSLMPSSNASRMPQHPGMHRRPQFLQMDNFRRDDDVEMIQSPRIKRHRQNDGNPYLSPLSSWPGNAQRLGRPPISAVGYDEHRGPMPGPRNVMYQLQSHGIMNPPPRPSPLQDQNPHYQGGKGQNFDESLRLPPLQTQLHHAKSNSRPENQRLMGSDSQKRSIEAMVMTIPFINKIKVLNKISPPLAANGPTSPGQETRGVVIAVEGVDLKLVGEVGRYIEDCLSKEPECFVKTWTGSTPSFPSSTRSSMAVASESSDAEMGNTTPNTKEPKGKAKDAPNSKASQDQEPKYPLDPFTAYLSEIQSWHAKSTEIISFITHHPATSSHSQCRSHSNAQTLDPTSTSDLKRHSPSCSPTSTPPPAASDSKGSANARKRIPIALMPTGFSLTFSDRSAATIPINDAYAPVDHWQWMATLWRGIVGPDLTVYVTGAAMLDDDGGGGGGGNGGIGTKDGGSVECRLDCRAMVVRAAAREDIGEKVLRRVGFEVSEFVRGVGFGGAD